MSQEKQYVISKTIKGTIAYKEHPALGRLYFYFVDESECNCPNYYGTTTDIELATIIPEIESEERNDYLADARLNASDLRSVSELMGKLNLDLLDLQSWWWQAKWCIEVAHTKKLYLEDINGFLGYTPQWGDTPLIFTEADFVREPYLKNIGTVEECSHQDAIS